MRTRLSIAILGAAVVFSGFRAFAQTTNQTGTGQEKTSLKSVTPRTPDQGNSQGKGKNKPTVAERPTVIPRDSAADSSGSDKGKGKPDKPERSDNPALPTEVKSLVTSFQSARETYLNQQQDLRRQLKEATDEQREAIREQIRESLDRWKEQHQQFVKDVKERAKEMKEQLQPDLGRLIDQGSKDGNERGR